MQPVERRHRRRSDQRVDGVEQHAAGHVQAVDLLAGDAETDQQVVGDDRQVALMAELDGHLIGCRAVVQDHRLPVLHKVGRGPPDRLFRGEVLALAHLVGHVDDSARIPREHTAVCPTDQAAPGQLRQVAADRRAVHIEFERQRRGVDKPRLMDVAQQRPAPVRSPHWGSPPPHRVRPPSPHWHGTSLVQRILHAICGLTAHIRAD